MAFLWTTLATDSQYCRPSELAARCHRIAKAYDRERDSRPKGKSKAGIQANTRLRAGLYSLVLDCLTDELMEDLEALAAKGGHDLAMSGNPFHIGLSAIFSGGRPPPPRQTQERLWRQAWHAYRHFVPPALLEGFLLQCRAVNIVERAAENTIEPGFENWIGRNLAAAEFEDEELNSKLIYPTSINKIFDDEAKSLSRRWERRLSAALSRERAKQNANHDEDDDDDDGWE